MDTRTEEIADQLMEALHQQLPSSNFLLKGIEVQLGALVDLEVADLQRALQQRLPAVDIRITVMEALMQCTDCGAQYPPDEHPCPVCGSPHAHMVHGHELEIVRAWGETI